MIHVTVTSRDGTRELARIEIENLLTGTADEADYGVTFGVDTADGFAVYSRAVYNFPRKDYNVLGLLRLALSTLEEKELSLDGDPDAPRPSGYAALPRHLAGG